MLGATRNRAVEVGIAVGATLAAIDDINALEWEFELFGKGDDAITKGSLGKRRQLIEEGLDQCWVEHHGNNLKGEEKDDDVGCSMVSKSVTLDSRRHLWHSCKLTDEAITCPADQLDETCHEWAHQAYSHGPLLDSVDEKGANGHLVETVLLLEHEMPIERDGQHGHRRDELRDQQEQE